MEPGWQCPYCGLQTDLSSVKMQRSVVMMEAQDEGALTSKALVLELAVCPNTYCKETQAGVNMYTVSGGSVQSGDPPIKSWNLIPSFAGRGMPDYVPAAVRDEYEQACAIRDASPNASATLARRCLQAMIRDFWGIRENFLSNAIDALREKMDEETFEAIDAVRSAGKLRQAMEKGTNLIHDSAPEDAALLIGLIEYLVEEWYVSRDTRKQRLKRIKGLPPRVSASMPVTTSRGPPPPPPPPPPPKDQLD